MLKEWLNYISNTVHKLDDSYVDCFKQEKEDNVIFSSDFNKSSKFYYYYLKRFQSRIGNKI